MESTTGYKEGTMLKVIVRQRGTLLRDNSPAMGIRSDVKPSKNAGNGVRKAETGLVWSKKGNAQHPTREIEWQKPCTSVSEKSLFLPFISLGRS